MKEPTASAVHCRRWCLITTTAGSGSDISQFCIITDVERAVKMSIITRTLVPNISIVDPLILRTKSETLIIQSAMDAMAHAIEAYMSTISSSFTEMQSLKSIDLIFHYLARAVETRSLDSLEQLSIASVAASMAFSNASLGAEHALAHSLGGHFDMRHGVVHPILLTAVMRFNLDYAEEKLGDIGRVILNRRLDRTGIPLLPASKGWRSSLPPSRYLQTQQEIDKKDNIF